MMPTKAIIFVVKLLRQITLGNFLEFSTLLKKKELSCMHLQSKSRILHYISVQMTHDPFSFKENPRKSLLEHLFLIMEGYEVDCNQNDWFYHSYYLQEVSLALLKPPNSTFKKHQKVSMHVEFCIEDLVYVIRGFRPKSVGFGNLFIVIQLKMRKS